MLVVKTKTIKSEGGLLMFSTTNPDHSISSPRIPSYVAMSSSQLKAEQPPGGEQEQGQCTLLLLRG